MPTTIQISEELKNELIKKKLYDQETYEEVIWDLIEDTMEINEQTVKDIVESQKEFERGEFVTLEEAKKELGL